jgi:hypothetical protein
MFGALRVVAFHSHPFINRHPYFGRLIAILLSKAQLVARRSSSEDLFAAQGFPDIVRLNPADHYVTAATTNSVITPCLWRIGHEIQGMEKYEQ